MLKIFILSIIIGFPVSVHANVNFVMDTEFVSVKEDTLNNNQDSLVLKRKHCDMDSIPIIRSNCRKDSLLHIRFLRYSDSIEKKYRNDAFKFKYDSFREEMKEPWLGNLLKNILFR